MKLANRATGALIVSLAVAIASPVQAQLKGSKVRITASNGFGGGGYICKSAFTLTTVTGGGELLGSDWSGSRCVGFYTGDITDNLLTLTVGEGGNYSYADFNLQVLSGGTIADFSFLGYNGVFLDPTYPANQSNFPPVTTFGGNSVDVVWDTGNSDTQFGFGGQGDGPNTATFLITTTPTDGNTAPQNGTSGASGPPALAASVTPEPATMTMLATGLVGMAGAARRRKRAKF